MTQEAVKFIFLFMLGTTVINFASAIVARIKTGHKEFSTLILYWFTLLAMYGAIVSLGGSEKEIAFAYFFQFIPSLIITQMLRDSIGMETSIRRFVGWQLAGMGASAFLILNTDVGFTISLLPVTLSTALPFFAPTWATLFSKKHQVNWVEKVMGFMFFTAIINHFNYAFFRLDPDAAWWGWSVAFAQYQTLSIFLPLLINYRREENEKKNLHAALARMSGAHGTTSPQVDVLYRELDFLIAQKEQFSKKLELANTRLEDEQEMNEMLIRTVSHDLANPLTVVNAYVSMIQSGKVTQTELPNILERVRTNLSAATGMIERIRNAIVTRTQSSLLTMKDVHVDDCVARLQDMFETRLKAKNITLVYENLTPGLNVSADQNTLTEHVLANILSNAIKFSFEHGTIRIRVAREGEQVLISVSDQGLGIEKKRLGKRLLASTSGTQGETGSGLGLMVMGYFIRKFEGSFLIESETEGDHHGTTVQIALKPAIPTHLSSSPSVESAQFLN